MTKLVVRHVGCRLAGVLLAALVWAGCSDGPSTTAGATPAVDQDDELRIIQHEEPRRDFVGPAPPRFRWSAVAGADRYAIGLWNEADRLLWRQDDLAETTVRWPEGLPTEPGTYFWSVSALRSGREIAKSGMAAFVVE